MSTELQSGKVLEGGAVRSSAGVPGERFPASPQLRSPSDSVSVDGGPVQGQVSQVSSETVGAVSGVKAVPPPLPHVEINQVSLAVIVRNLTVFTIKEIVQYMKTNVHSSPEQGTLLRKVNFLQLIIYLRNQFLRLYVLVKWARTIKDNNFNVLIDLLNWFRNTNVSVNNCIWALKGTLASMANAKLPNVDLVTALEVLSLGRPNLPTHNFKLSGEKQTLEIPPELILQRLKDLNLTVSIKIALMDLPTQFKDYRIANGRIYIFVQDEFEIQLSTIDSHAPLFFVDLDLLFHYRDSKTGDHMNNGGTAQDDNTAAAHKTANYLPLNKRKLEKLINDLLRKSDKPFFALYKFLHKYVLTLKLYMVHMELTNLETTVKFSGGNLVHSYDAKKSIISGRYWLNAKMGNRGKYTIGVDRYTEMLVLRWDNDATKLKSMRMPTVYKRILGNVESILDEIMFNHANLIKSELLSRGIFEDDEDDPNVLLLQVPTTCISNAPVQLKIDLITGLFYFKNPSSLLSSYTKKINAADSPEELTRTLLQLKLDKITHILKNMFEKTGWICNSSIKLPNLIPTQLMKTADTESTELGLTNGKSMAGSLLQFDLFVCLPNWPVNWYLILTIISSDSSCVIEKRMGKIVSQKNKWHLSYLDQSGVTSYKLEALTYQKIMSLQKTILHRIVNHTLIDSLNQLKIRNHVCSADVVSNLLPDYIVKESEIKDEQGDLDMDSVAANKEDYTSIIDLELESFLEGSKALNGILENSMFMRINYAKSETRLYARFKRDTMIKQVQCNDLLIHFVPEDPLAFYLDEKFSDLSHIISDLATFRKKLMQLVVLTDVVERLHKNFASEWFKIVALKPNEIAFKYLHDTSEKADCTITIITSDSTVKNLDIELAKSNPQCIIQPLINTGKVDYHFIFHYLQFTSSFFSTLQKVLVPEDDTSDEGAPTFTQIHLGVHSLREYQLVYHNPISGTKITVIIELKSVCHNNRMKMQYYIHFSREEHVTAKSPAYPLIHAIRNQIFMLDMKQYPHPQQQQQPATVDTKYPKAVRLLDGIACDAADVGPILLDIHSILRMDSNTDLNGVV
ncbi:Rgr1p KNAG_0L00210 [Huiozyma naganishii CBS 8797]|uniref:Mediator of RNA polymerase II transcription subunit 14 n=1 Tax=Huiozyma naganishii (strain ATCC MYA-139 / BCRC 22969 / CBS 8797 / KCTC 17520 / NBRC 10181 / NCYC 3082 / Yp74L-3) TaxID=1071383 RepID=J7SAC8_HUIN7|nr:hypothetical protein KNAG_0L00210 [Kazachstania naganishii CBS 8797]CCK72644.1 hypothetical protein KNAG_0L00210 [Kazachstania naganishii CBS 8797]